MRSAGAFLLLAAAVAGCAAPVPGPAPGDTAAWAAGLDGPFDLARVDHVQVDSFDGTVLDGWLFFPAVPAGTSLPAILVDDPYYGQLSPTPEAAYEGSYTERFVEAGYAVAEFSVRGTGNSGGCWTVYGPEERKDVVALAEWLSAEAWSNGRVGMFGASYSGTTPLMAAVEAPPALRAIAVAAVDVDVYQLLYTPQGAPWWHAAATPAAYWASESVVPPIRSTDPQHGTVDHAPTLADRACPDAVRGVTQGPMTTAGEDRDQAFWDERRLTGRAANVTAAVMFSFGVRDWQTHFQDGLLWQALGDAPKRMYVGDWGHDYPWEHVDREDELVLWFDAWLKDRGEPPALGVVTTLDQEGTLRDLDAWPPSTARAEVLHLVGDALARSPGEGPRTFRTARALGGENNALWLFGERTYDPAMALCAPDDRPTAAVYRSEPVAGPVFLAGAPLLHLALESSEAGGLVAAGLYDVGPEFACREGQPTGATKVALGAADLRYHAGNFRAEPFPVGRTTPLRIDLHETVHTIAPGHRLALVLDGGDPGGRASTTHAPTITLHAGEPGASQLVLPVAAGTLGGTAPAIPFLPRPFAP